MGNRLELQVHLQACTNISTIAKLMLFLHRLVRECAKEYKYGKITIPSGCPIMMATPLLHKDPEYWKDPEKFDPMR